LHLDLAKLFIVEIDASNLQSVLFSLDLMKTGILHHIPFYSKKLTPSKINHPIYDKELSAIIVTFEEWRTSLAEAKHHVPGYD
jgi:hypothetical protein